MKFRYCLYLGLLLGFWNVAQAEGNIYGSPMLVAPLEEGLQVVPLWKGLHVSGSAARLGKYAVPLKGATFCAFLQNTQEKQNRLEILLFSPGEATASGTLRYTVPFPEAHLTLQGDRSRFHLYPDVGGSIRQNWLFAGGSRLADGKTYAHAEIQHTNLRIAKVAYPIDWSALTTSFLATRPIGSGDVTVSLHLQDLVHRTGREVGFHRAGYRLHYATDWGRRAFLDLDYLRSEATLLGRSPAVESAALQITSPVGSNWVALARLDGRRIGQPMAQTAFTRASHAARFEIRYSGIRGLQARMGCERTESARVNRAHSRTDHPVWDKIWLSASYRPLRRWQIVGKAFARSTDNPPLSGLSDPALGPVQSTRPPLGVNLERGAECRVQGSLSDGLYLYGAAATRYRKNTLRLVEVQYDTTSLGGWLQVGPRASAHADYTLIWADSTNLPVAQWMSDSKVTTVGGTWALLHRLTLEGYYTCHRATGQQNVAQHIWGLGLRFPNASPFAWSLDFQRDQYRDRLNSAQNYTARLVAIRGSILF